MLVAAFSVVGCLANRVEEADPDVFACDEALDCAEGEICLLGRCHEGDAPRLTIRTPEAFEAITPQPEDPPGRISVTVGIGGEDLLLVEPSTDVAEISQGFVEVLVDGATVTYVTSGDLFAGATTTVEIDASPGAHRITAIARLADGTRYDNAGAMSTRIVWVDDSRPHVAIVKPWPGSEHTANATSIDVEIATLNFTLVPPLESFEGEHGHAHVHYDDYFPYCPQDEMCDCCYVGIVAPLIATNRWTVTTPIPAAGAGPATLTAVLRASDHEPFVHDGAYVFDTIEIERSTDAPQPLPTE